MRKGIIGSILMGLPLLLVGCGIAIEWGPLPPPPGEEPSGGYELRLECPNCYLPFMGYAPLLVKGVVQADAEEFDPDVVVEWDWGDGTRDKSALNQEIRHVYETPGIYGVSVRAGEQLWGQAVSVSPPPEEGLIIAEPWVKGDRGFCEARRVFLDDPYRVDPQGNEVEVRYRVEILQRYPRLEAIKVDDRAPYPVKYEPVYYWITPAPGPHWVENALLFREKPQGYLWVTEVKCISQADDKGLGGGITDVIELRMKL